MSKVSLRNTKNDEEVSKNDSQRMKLGQKPIKRKVEKEYKNFNKHMQMIKRKYSESLSRLFKIK